MAIAKPRRLRPGDVVAVIAPSGAVDEARLEAGVRVLEGWGLRVVLGESVRARQAYLAGADEARRGDLQRMIDDPDIRAIFCARGGYGSQRLLPLLHFDRLARQPKAIVGYSDATALLNAAVGAGAVAVHGPMVADDLASGVTPNSAQRLWAVLSDPEYLWEDEVPEIVRPGRAAGRLLGGCLSVLVATLGTPHAPDTTGAILFLEDVHEFPYRVDRLLTQLRQAGKLDRLAGLVFGTMAACRGVAGVHPLDVVREFFRDAPYPVGIGLPAGHDPGPAERENHALPLGVRVTIDTERGRLAALEPAVL